MSPPLRSEPGHLLQHKMLYRRVRGEVPPGAYTTPQSANTVRDGDDMVVIAYGAMVHAALAGRRADRRGERARARPAHARPARRARDPRRRARLRQGGGRRRGQLHLRRGRAGRVADRPVRLRATSTARSSGSPRPTRRSPSRCRSSAPRCPASSGSGTPAVSSSPTESAGERLLEIVMPQLGITVTEGTLVGVAQGAR